VGLTSSTSFKTITSTVTDISATGGTCAATPLELYTTDTPELAQTPLIALYVSAASATASITTSPSQTPPATGAY
jgi:hypothetical protein